ncbi:Thioredoxin-like fold containing protein [Parasponia andersonii]|uniref:Thioredoxin-like fold containing protein n=1 Tax=Parasponia andersonii TaxID=3476 RepID=A0A2P5DJF2_PARAD|nr:Thioredoxin-like fold containing protein [Parasponia andersonii]
MQGPRYTTLILQLAFFLFFFVSVIYAQSLPPAKSDGFVYGNHRVDWDAILIEAFLDPVCPDSRDAWPPLKQALAHYGDRVRLIVHLLPLPYHDNAFVASRAIHIVNDLSSPATFKLLEWFFKYQEKFYNAQTRSLTRTEVVNEIVKAASQVVGSSFYSSLVSGFNDRKTDLKTRVSFKYSASRGVYGTPTFFINGFQLPDSGSALDFNGWKNFIDPLIGQKSAKNEENLHFFL